MMTIRRLGVWEDNDSAACRPRPNVEPCFLAPRRAKPLPVWPALFAACITWPMKVFGLPAPRLRRMRPGRTRKSSSRAFIVEPRCAETADVGGGIDFHGIWGGSASTAVGCEHSRHQSNQPHAPDRGRRFYLALPDLFVSVLSLHSSSGMLWRAISGSFVHERLSGGVETLRERSTVCMV